jgi:hypothetical protein
MLNFAGDVLRVVDGTAQESAALFAEKGALELPYLADLGVDGDSLRLPL